MIWRYLTIILFLIGTCTGCEIFENTSTEIGYTPPVVPVRVSVNSHGEVELGVEPALVTPIGTFDLGGSSTIASIRRNEAHKVLIVRVDDKAQVFKLEEGKDFKANFEGGSASYKKVAIEYESDGDIVLELESSTGSPTSVLEWLTIGQSVRGRDISVAKIGDGGQTAIVIVGSIEGTQTPTRDLVEASLRYFDRNPRHIPSSTTFHFIPSLNPDGNASGSRYNANGVDLNRNWDTSDWRSDAAVPGYSNGKAGTGGARPFSEPETRALRDYLFQLDRHFSVLHVVVIHSSVNRSSGEVYPGGNLAASLAKKYATIAGYNTKTDWIEYTTSGELVTWCGEEDITSIDIVIPASQTPYSQVSGSRTLLDVTIEGLLEVARYQ
jgi:hypothetical protein